MDASNSISNICMSKSTNPAPAQAFYLLCGKTKLNNHITQNTFKMCSQTIKIVKNFVAYNWKTKLKNHISYTKHKMNLICVNLS